MSPSSRSSSGPRFQRSTVPGEIGRLVTDLTVLVEEHDEMVGTVDEEAGLAVDRHLRG